MEIQIYVINEYFGIIVINKSRDTRCQVPLNSDLITLCKKQNQVQLKCATNSMTT